MKKFVLALAFVVAIAISGAVMTSIAAEKKKVFDFDYETKDGFIVRSTLTYPPVEKNSYAMVVLLHSLGYSSEEWGLMKYDFNQAGLAVLEIDFKGHGKSLNDIHFKRRSWIYLSEKAFSDYPNEVLESLKQVLEQRKDIAQNYVAYVGADIGANTAIMAAKSQYPKPVCLALISPSMEFKGLYVPISLANAGNIPILAMASAKDRKTLSEINDIEKYAQGSYTKRIYEHGGTGMLMLKLNPPMTVDIVNWVVDEINKKAAGEE